MGVPGDHWHSDPFYFTRGVWYIFLCLETKKTSSEHQGPLKSQGCSQGAGNKTSEANPKGKKQFQEHSNRSEQPFFFFFRAPLGKQSLSHLFGTPFPWSFCQQFQAKGIGKSREKP